MRGLSLVEKTAARPEQPQTAPVPGPEWLDGFLHEALRHPGGNLAVGFAFNGQDEALTVLAASRRGIAVVNLDPDAPQFPEVCLIEWVAVSAIRIKGGQVSVHAAGLDSPATVRFSDQFDAQDFVGLLSRLRWP